MRNWRRYCEDTVGNVEEVEKSRYRRSLGATSWDGHRLSDLSWKLEGSTPLTEEARDEDDRMRLDTSIPAVMEQAMIKDNEDPNHAKEERADLAVGPPRLIDLIDQNMGGNPGGSTFESFEVALWE